LSFIENNILNEEVIKQPSKAEAIRFYNFPYEAIEEALSNAIYHKSYELGSPIEVQVWPDKIEILSYPGPVPPVNAEVLKSQRRIVTREYRNRRIGDFLKELHLTEDRGTGFPTIYDAMAENGSPVPLFETDELTYVLVILPIHHLSGTGTRVSDQASDQVKIFNFKSLSEIISFCNQASDQASDQASTIIKNEVHERYVHRRKSSTSDRDRQTHGKSRGI
jgi:ATP-dependent DNA helicase RecG